MKSVVIVGRVVAMKKEKKKKKTRDYDLRNRNAMPHYGKSYNIRANERGLCPG